MKNSDFGKAEKLMTDFNDSGFLFSYIRFMNLSPQGGSIDFYVGSTLICAGIKFGSYSPYIKTASSPQVYKATRSGRKDELIDKITLSQDVGRVHSLCVCGMADEAKFMPLEEPIQKPIEGYGKLRICNFSPGSTAFDIWANDEKILEDINYKEQSRYMNIKPGVYNFALSKNRSETQKLSGHEIKPGKSYSLYIIGTENEMPHLSGLFTLDAASYGGFYLL
jgi:hypothetical protein